MDNITTRRSTFLRQPGISWVKAVNLSARIQFLEKLGLGIVIHLFLLTLQCNRCDILASEKLQHAIKNILSGVIY